MLRNVMLPSWSLGTFKVILVEVNKQKWTYPASEPTMHRSRTSVLGMPNSATGKWAVLGFETTGTNPGRGDRAIEVAISLCVDGVEIDTYSSLINPGVPIDDHIGKLTGISSDMVNAAPNAKDVMRDAVDFVGDAQLVAHNSGFYRKLWRHELSEALTTDDDREFLCTLKLSRRVFQSFVGHKLDQIAQELGIEPVQSQRALADAQTTSRILFIMSQRLQIAHPDETVDVNFLKSYQKRTKASVPDLSIDKRASVTAEHALESGQSENSAHKHAEPISLAVDKAAMAEQMNADAKQATQELARLLKRTLSNSDRLDWSTLSESKPFKSSIRKRSFIRYDKRDMPVDIDYLSMPEAQPTQPDVPPKPSSTDFAPQVEFIDKLLLREPRLVNSARESYQRAVEQWKTSAEQNQLNYEQALQSWFDTAKSIDEENNQRYQQCIEDQKQWHAELLDHQKKIKVADEDLAVFKQAYELGNRQAVEKFILEVLAHSNYPDYFPDDVSVEYQPAKKMLHVRVKLLHPDDLPTLTSVAYSKARNEIKPKLLSVSARNALYTNVVRAVAIRTLHEVFETDAADKISHVIVNGYVDTVNLTTRLDQQTVVVSLHSSKKQFAALILNKADVGELFEKLNGRGSTSSIPKLTNVKPIKFTDLAAC
jgi:DNA polymerase III epsilon subunit-like protein